MTSWSYRGARAVLATMHGKEAVIAPAMRDIVGVDVVIPVGVDTDALGTFTGETPRRGSMRDVAIAKARLGMQASGLRLGLASEGSFGPHPVVPFLRAGLELMVLVDDERGIVITESLVANETNHDEIVVGGFSELDAFLPRVGFPAHALVVTPNQTASPWWRLHPELAKPEKAITSHPALVAAINRCALRSDDRLARVTTDMRAHVNPTRMKAISVLADRLARRIASPCPECGAPGFGCVGQSQGLPCGGCGAESLIPRGDIMRCLSCSAEREEARSLSRQVADPGDCPQCNP